MEEVVGEDVRLLIKVMKNARLASQHAPLSPNSDPKSVCFLHLCVVLLLPPFLVFSTALFPRSLHQSLPVT